mgnify:FL=1
MKINSLNIASFKKFKDKKIDFSNGLNLVIGNNESGKSTIMAFIKVMLFGFGSKSDREKYVPWDGAAVFGEMEIEHGNTTYIISRKMGKSKAYDKLDIIDKQSGKKLDLSVENLLSISEETFLKTVFVDQLACVFDKKGTDEMATKLRNLSESLDEDISYENAREALESLQRFLVHKRGNGGKISEIEEKIIHIDSQINYLKRKHDELNSCQIEIKNAKERLENLKQARSKIQAQKKLAQKANYYAIYTSQKNLAEKIKLNILDLENKISETQNKLNELEKFKNADNVAFHKIENNQELKIEHTKLSEKIKYYSLFFILSLCVTLAFCALCVFYKRVFAFTLPPFVVLTIYFSIGRSNIKRKVKILEESISRINEMEEENQNILNSFNSSSIEEFNFKKNEYLKLDAENLNLNNRLKEQKGEYDRVCIEIERLKVEITKTFGEFSPHEGEINYEYEKEQEDKINDEIVECERKIASLTEKISSLETETSKIDDFFSEKNALSELREKYVNTYMAANLAIEALDKAASDLSKNFTPKLNEKASQIFEKITKTNRPLIISSDFDINVSDKTTKEIDNFSFGTIDQAYFSLRMALSDILFGGFPLILDDPFLQYDEDRLKQALDYLVFISRNRQVILFTATEYDVDSSFAKIIKL